MNKISMINQISQVYSYNSTLVIFTLIFIVSVISLFIILLININRRKRAEEELDNYRIHLQDLVEERTKELKRTNEQLKAFTYTISHDLRAPLRAMEGFSDALLEDYQEKLDDEGVEYARRINRAAERMDKLINDLLEYSRFTKDEINLKTVDMDSVINKVVNNLNNKINNKSANLIIEKDLPEVIGHKQTLNRVMENLISNSLKFIDRKTNPEIKIYSEENDGSVYIYVEDNGIGIKEDHQNRIFNIFERLHHQESIEGTGVGLAIVKKSVENMSGEVGIESSPGEGSTFWIKLDKAS